MKEFNPTSSLQELHPVQLRTQSKSIYIAREPLTLDARRQALHSETREAVSEYYGKLLTRSWIPTKLPFREMQRLGGRLSEDTVTLLEGFMGVVFFAQKWSILHGTIGPLKHPYRGGLKRGGFWP